MALNALHVFPHVHISPSFGVTFFYRHYLPGERRIWRDLYEVPLEPIGLLRRLVNGYLDTQWGIFATSDDCEQLLQLVAQTNDIGYIPKGEARNEIINDLTA